MASHKEGRSELKQSAGGLAMRSTVHKVLLATWCVFVGGWIVLSSAVAADHWFPEGGLREVSVLFGVFLGLVVGGGIWNRWSDKIGQPSE